MSDLTERTLKEGYDIQARQRDRIRELEAELAADNELFQQRWREWQAERDRLDHSMRESWASEKRLAARISDLEAKLADAKLDGSRHANRVLRLMVVARDERIHGLEAALLRHGHKEGSCGLCAALTTLVAACTGCYYPTPGEFVRRQDCPIHGRPQSEREAN